MSDSIGNIVATADGVKGVTSAHALIVNAVRDFASKPQGPSDALTAALLGVDREDLTARAGVRYLMRVGAWRYEPNGDFNRAMNHLFAHYEGRPAVEPETYQEQTKQIIQDLWGFECVPIVIVPKEAAAKPERKPNPGKVTRRPRMISDDEAAQYNEEGESGSRTFKSINEQAAEPKKPKVDTRGASARLKKVIDIQRNG